MQSIADVSNLQVSRTQHTTSIYIHQRDDYPNGPGSLGQPCGGGGGAATME